MQFELPGQFRGPECKALLPVCRRLKKEFRPDFASLGTGKIKEISPILRVGGSLGSFGSDAIENLKIRRGEVYCDVVIAPREWQSMTVEEIYSFLRPRVVAASKTMLAACGFTEMPTFLS